MLRLPTELRCQIFKGQFKKARATSKSTLAELNYEIKLTLYPKGMVEMNESLNMELTPDASDRIPLKFREFLQRFKRLTVYIDADLDYLHAFLAPHIMDTKIKMSFTKRALECIYFATTAKTEYQVLVANPQGGFIMHSVSAIRLTHKRILGMLSCFADDPPAWDTTALNFILHHHMDPYLSSKRTSLQLIRYDQNVRALLSPVIKYTSLLEATSFAHRYKWRMIRLYAEALINQLTGNSEEERTRLESEQGESSSSDEDGYWDHE